MSGRIHKVASSKNSRWRQRFRQAAGMLAAGCLAVGGSAAADDAHDTSRWWSWGGDLRMRNEYFDNARTLDSSTPRHEQNFQRVRARVWSTVRPAETITATARLTWEGWNWSRDSYKPPHRRGWVSSEGTFDLLNFTWSKPGGLPLGVIIGRQEIHLGDGWLVAEGTPLDGSRTTYFDAVRATIQFSDRTTLEIACLDQAAKCDGRLSALNDQNVALAEQDERSAFVYLTHRTHAQTQFDAYWIHRDLTRVLPGGDSGRSSAVGTRVVATPAKQWLLKGEAVCEFGTKNSRDLRAWGFLGQAVWRAGDAVNQNYRFTVEALSGDRPGTDADEQFDLLWGRYPRWSEISIMLFAPETRVAQLGNLLRVGPGWSFDLSRKSSVSVDYYVAWALENNRADAGWFGFGRFRGHFGRSALTYRFSSRWAGTLLGEVFAPGSYYAPARQDNAVFMRTDLVFRF